MSRLLHLKGRSSDQHHIGSGRPRAQEHLSTTCSFLGHKSTSAPRFFSDVLLLTSQPPETERPEQPWPSRRSPSHPIPSGQHSAAVRDPAGVATESRRGKKKGWPVVEMRVTSCRHNGPCCRLLDDVSHQSALRFLSRPAVVRRDFTSEGFPCRVSTSRRVTTLTTHTCTRLDSG